MKEAQIVISRPGPATLADVPGVLRDYLCSVYGENLRALFLYGSSLLRSGNRELGELSREDFEDKRCDFIAVMEDKEAALLRLSSHWPTWTPATGQEMIDLGRELGGRIVYFVPETVHTYRVEFADGNGGREVHDGYHIPYKFGILGYGELLRDLSEKRPHFYVAGRASKWSSRNLLYTRDEETRGAVEEGLARNRRDVAEIAHHLARVPGIDELVFRYFLFSYLCEAWRLDFHSKPRALVAGLGDDVRDLVRNALDSVPAPARPDRAMRKRILRTIVRGNLVSMRMSLGNSRSNRHAWSPNRMAGNASYVRRKLANILPDILMLPLRIPVWGWRVVRWRWF